MNTYKITVYNNGEEFHYYLLAQDEEEATDMTHEDYPAAYSIIVEER